mmetsp:Transcript_12876/g.14784  ORF Transcript_12876/g.14784 Transcript_12876/m.14784 type:complete len:83 (-) Transcript_12876:107-355(-)
MSGLDESEQEFVRRSDVFYSGLYLAKACAKGCGVFKQFKTGFLGDQEINCLNVCAQNIQDTKTPFMLNARAKLLSPSEANSE